MLYKGESFEEIEKSFYKKEEKRLKSICNLKRNKVKRRIRFKKDLLLIEKALDYCIQRFEGKTVNKCWSYFKRHLKNIQVYLLY